MHGFRQDGGEGKTCFYKKGKLALRGTLCGSLYLMDGEKILPSANVAVGKDDTAFWHCRLAHTSMRNLRVLVEKGIVDKKKISEMDFCERCVMGKNKSLSFNVGKHNGDQMVRCTYTLTFGVRLMYTCLYLFPVHHI